MPFKPLATVSLVVLVAFSGFAGFAHAATSQQVSTSTAPTTSFNGPLNIAGLLIKSLQNGNIAIGNVDTLATTTSGIGRDDLAIGQSALQDVTTMNAATAIGYGAGQDLTTGRTATYLGYVAGQYNTGGESNTFIGAYAGRGGPSTGPLTPQFNGEQNTCEGEASCIDITGNANFNTAYGYNTLFSNTTGSSNNAFGDGAGYLLQTTSGNSFFGNTAGHFNTGKYGAGFGAGALSGYNFLTTTTGDTASGTATIDVPSTAAFNVGDTIVAGGYFQTYPPPTIISINSAASTITVSEGTFQDMPTGSSFVDVPSPSTATGGVGIGEYACAGIEGPTLCTGVGNQALLNDTTGTPNVALGSLAGKNLTAGNYDVFVGNGSGISLTTGSDNTLLGSDNNPAYANLTTGSQNIGIGYDAQFASTTANGQLDIGNFIYGTNLTGIGTALSAGQIGIGTTTPYSPLTVWGPDTSSSTAVLTISNSASTTEFQVFDNGSAALAGTLTQNSDERLKTNIQSLSGSTTLADILLLNPVSFNWIDPSRGTAQQLGFKAQDVEQIFPQLVSTTSATTLTPGGTLSLNYIGLIAPTIEAVKELASEIQGFSQSFTSQKITAKNELCVGTTCVDQAQLQVLLQQSAQTASK